MKSHLSISISLLILVAFTYQTILASDLPIRGRNGGVPQLNEKQANMFKQEANLLRKELANPVVNAGGGDVTKRNNNENSNNRNNNRNNINNNNKEFVNEAKQLEQDVFDKAQATEVVAQAKMNEQARETKKAMGMLNNAGLRNDNGAASLKAERDRLALRNPFGVVSTGQTNKHRIQQALDDFNLPKIPVTLPGANIPKPIHPEVPPGPNSCCGDGDWDATIRACVCKPLFYGPRCQFKKLNKHAHGRYTCPTICPRGVEQAGAGKCICPDGWGGQHCQIPKCLHGRLGCPTGNKFCVKPQCLCSPGWEGQRCGHKPVPKTASNNNMFHRAITKKKKKPSTPCNGKDLPCQNTGTFSWETCSCNCLPPFTGKVCEKCIKQQCAKGKMQDPNTCGCMCPPTKQCKNNGVLDDGTCGCSCVNSWHGEQCEKCTPKSCNGHGVWDNKQCACLCDAPWLPDTQCKTCGHMECGEHGTFVEKDCNCKCKGNWKGIQCDECPTKEERIVAGIDCGLHAWDEEKCECKEQCEPLDCQHDGFQDPKTCNCKCNPQGNGTDASQSGDSKLLTKATFWSGDTCQTCEQPDKNPCPGSRTFNLTKCGCEESCPDIKCENGGVLNNETCTCDCAPGWGGKTCTELADGTTKMLAATSCKAAQAVRPGNATTGKYWINPTGTNPNENAFQVVCDMQEDGGGWIEIANIGDNMRKMQIYKDKYQKGYQATNIDGEHIFPCSAFDGLDGGEGDLENVVVRLSMGKVRDYFKPIPGKSLCDMLTSQNNHMWSANGGVPSKDGGGGQWLRPTYNQDPNLKNLLGGSNATYPKDIDGRQFLSFWGGDDGGCCHQYSTIYPDKNGGADKAQWGSAFKMYAQEVLPPGKPIVDAGAESAAKGEGKSFLEISESPVLNKLKQLLNIVGNNKKQF